MSKLKEFAKALKKKNGGAPIQMPCGHWDFWWHRGEGDEESFCRGCRGKVPMSRYQRVSRLVRQLPVWVEELHRQLSVVDGLARGQDVVDTDLLEALGVLNARSTTLGLVVRELFAEAVNSEGFTEEMVARLVADEVE